MLNLGVDGSHKVLNDMKPICVFVSSRQKEFRNERRRICDYIQNDPLRNRFFEVILFEDAPASDQRPDQLYLEEVKRCDVYIGLFGQEYGLPNEEGLSPTEQEFNLASELRKHRLIYIKRVDDRDELMTQLVAKADKQVVRRSFGTAEDLLREVDASLIEFLVTNLSTKLESTGNDKCRTTAEAEKTIRNYKTAYRKAYVDELVPFGCRSKDGPMFTDDVTSLIVSGDQNILVYGSSGCGKTLIAISSSLIFNRNYGIAITVPIKIYRESLMNTIDKVVRGMGISSAVKLLSAAQVLNLPILLTIDGYNESDPGVRELLTIEISAFVKQYNAKILVTSQILPERSNLLQLLDIEALPASQESKTIIAQKTMGEKKLSHEIEVLLEAVTTGLEARLVGEVGQDLRAQASRFTLFETYARKRLGHNASDGISILSHVADWLTDRMSFSLSVRDLDRLVNKRRLSKTTTDRLKEIGLLTLHADRISFVHEMFFDAFAAEAVVRGSLDSPESIIAALKAPVHAARREFIIGAINDPLLLTQVLNELPNSDSVIVCRMGICGHPAMNWAESQFKRLFKKIEDEAGQIQVVVSVQDLLKVRFDKNSLSKWNTLEQALLGALPRLMMKGYYLEETLSVVSTLDKRVNQEAKRLTDEARQNGIPLTDSLFAICYTFNSLSRTAVPAISRICKNLHSGIYQIDVDKWLKQIGKRLHDNLSFGQIYVLLGLSHHPNAADFVTPFLTRYIRSNWNSVPAHLALELMHSAGMCFYSSEPQKAALIEVIESVLLQEPDNIHISGAVFDALKNLGALKDSANEHRPTVFQQIQRCLSSPEDHENPIEAYRIYACKFDHPYSDAYNEVLDDLSAIERKTFLRMAAMGAPNDSFFLDILLKEILAYEDSNMAECFLRFVSPPPIDGVFPQRDVCVFIISHIALASFGWQLPDSIGEADSPYTKCLASCGLVLYWINRKDLETCTQRERCREPIQILEKHLNVGAIPALQICEPHYSYWKNLDPNEASDKKAIIELFSDEIADLCRTFLSQCPIELENDNTDLNSIETVGYAINTLALHGNYSDIALLRKLGDDSRFGTHAINAMREIEARFIVK